MGIECSCFRSDINAGTLEVPTKITIPPVYYEYPSIPFLEPLDLKSLCRGYISRSLLKIVSNPSSKYETFPYPISSFQSEKISEIEKTLENYTQIPCSPVYLINHEYYQGTFNKRLMKHGKGILILNDNRKYIGEFRLDKITGHGRMIFENGDVYEGQFKDDKAHGKGKYTQKNGTIYVGEFKDDKQDGIGFEILNNGTKYEGEYKNGMKHGRGIVKFSEEAFYDGEFFENRIEGKGIYRWNKEKWYSGDMVDSKMQGFGEYHNGSGLFYKGEFSQDLRHGFGVCMWNDGRMYEGYWKEGVQHGEGYFTSIGKDGEKIKKKGIWNSGKRETWIAPIDTFND